MNSCTNKKYNFLHKNWLSLLNVHEKQRKKTSRPTYSNLYAYVTDIALTTVSISGDLKLTKGLEKAGKVAGWISNIKFGVGLFKSYKNNILNCAIEELTCELFMHEMASNSPDISEKLYKFAKKKMNILYYSGNLNIDYNSTGGINSYNAKDPLDIEVIRNDINNYKRELKYGLSNE